MKRIKVTILGRVPQTEWDKPTDEHGKKTLDVDDHGKGRIKHLAPHDILDLDTVWISCNDGFLTAEELPSPIPTLLSKQHLVEMTECVAIHLQSGIILAEQTKAEIEELIKKVNNENGNHK